MANPASKQENDNKKIQQKSKVGLLAMGLRNLFVHALQMVSVLLLARWLTPQDYGTYGLLNAWVAVSWFFCDIGIAGALIQQKSDPSPRQLGFCLAIQLLLACSLTLLFIALAPIIINFHGIDPKEGQPMIFTLAALIPIYAIRGVPKLLLERKLEFKPIAKIEMTESLGLYITQIGLAALGFGVWSFIGGNIARAVIGSALYLKRFFKDSALSRPSINLQFSKNLDVIRYGLPFQANAIVPALKGLIIPVVLGSFLEVHTIGLITWTIGITAIPMVLANIYNQVVFPTLSRLQDSRDDLERVASRGLELSFLGLGYFFAAGAATAHLLIPIIFGEKWVPAAPFFPIAMLAFAFSTVRHLCASVLNATGIPMSRLKIELCSLIVEFSAAWILVQYWGAKGYFIALAAVHCLALLLTFYVIRQWLRTSTFYRFGVFLSSGALSTVVIHALDLHWILLLFLFHAVFFAIAIIGDRSVLGDLKWSLEQVRSVLKRRLAQ